MTVFGSDVNRGLLHVGRWIRLHHAEDMSIEVLAVRQPADAGHRHLGHHAFSPTFFDGRERLVKIRYGNGVHARLRRIAATQQTSVDAGLLGISGRDQPVFDWPVKLGEFSAEQVRVKGHRAVRVVHGNLKMHWSWHVSCHSPLCSLPLRSGAAHSLS